ncbi:hypothetical protein F4811DRAFT_553898 [Daldinia bambusicola]|nr:hypothetical protein F4811DRAFT_553898 [Daldinia bambusicola]
MAQAIKSALPSHLKPGGNDADSEFAGRHHGKTRSHMFGLSSKITVTVLYFQSLHHLRQIQIWDSLFNQ